MGTKKEPRRADTAIKEKNALLQRIAESVTDLGKKKYEQKSSKYLPASTIRVPPSVSGRGIPKTMKIDPAAPKAKYAGASREQEPALFEYYCGLGPQKRNFWRVAEYGGVSNATITFVAKKNKWVERVANFDSEVQKLINERIAEGLGELSQIEMARRAALISRHADIGQELQHYARFGMKKMRDKHFTGGFDDAVQVAKVAETGVKIERAAEGLEKLNGDGTQVNVNQSVGMVQNNINITIKPMKEFITEDLGVPFTSLFQRVLFVLELLERPDVVECVIMAGKSSGKTVLAKTFLTRVVQRLMTLADPALAYNLMPGEKIGIVNLSIKQMQAQLAIFEGFRKHVKEAPWFRKNVRAKDTDELIEFPKNVIALCGNSRSQSVEGLNFIAGCADEVCHLETEKAGIATAEDLVDPVRATMVSRFGERRKLLLMCWPSHTEDYLHKRIEQAESSGIKEDFTKRYIDCPITHGTLSEELAYRAKWNVPPFNEFPIKCLLTNSGTLIVQAPTWQVNPNTDMKSMKDEYEMSEFKFAQMYGAAPLRRGKNPFIRDLDAWKRGCTAELVHPFDEEGRFIIDEFRGSPQFLYFAHFDVGLRRDSAGFAVGHYQEGFVVIDCMLEVKVPKGGEIMLSRLVDLLSDMIKRGFDFNSATVDGFQGIAAQQEIASRGIEAEHLSVDKDKSAYETMKELHLAGKIRYYDYKPFLECLASLEEDKKMIDHTPAGKKDVSDAVAAVCKRIAEDYMGNVADAGFSVVKMKSDGRM